MGAFQDLVHSGRPLKIDVGYYDDAHKRLLSSFSCAAEIQKLVKTGVAIPAAEFLTYCLFVNKRETDAGLNTYGATGC